MNLFKSKKKNEARFEDIFSNAKVPILLNFEPFKNVVKYASTPKIKKEMKVLQDMIHEEKQHILEVNSLHKEKSRITASILYLSNQINQKGNHDSVKELEKRKNRMQEIIADIQSREKTIQDLRDRQEEQNLVLLRDTVEYAYDTMKRDEQDLEVLFKEIEKQREQLRKDREKRDALKLRLDSMYGFMHSMMGAKDTEKFDSEFFDEDED